MNYPKHKPAVVPPGGGRKITVLGQEITVQLNNVETGGDYFLFEAVMSPGSSVPPHIHSREDEIVEVLEGELEVFLDGKTSKAAAGAVAFFPRHIVHGFGNPGSAPARARFVVSPGANFEKFFGELCTLPATQPPDLAKVGEIFARFGLPIVAGPSA